MRIVKIISPLKRVEYTFWYDNKIFYLDSYEEYERENTHQKKYKTVKQYQRILHRNNNIALEDIELSEELKQEVLDAFIVQLKVKKWEK